MNKKRLALALLLIAALLAASITVMAEFTKSFRTKRVISATASDGMLFSSNYLQEDGDFAPFYIPRNDAEDTSIDYYDTVITIGNYAPSNPSRFYRRAINYTLTTSIVRLVTDGSGNTTTQTVLTDLPNVLLNGEALRSSYSRTIPSGGARNDELTLSLPRTMLTGERLYVLMTATPVGETYTDITPISALIELAIQPEASATTWHIDPTDNRTHAVGEYAGYNFRLSGSGRGTVILGWDNTRFALSPVFADAVGAETYSGSLPAEWSGLSAVSFDVDAAIINSYDIQFYLRSLSAASSWNDVSAVIIFEENTANAEP